MTGQDDMTTSVPKTERTWTEAPASATVKAKYRTREWMITLRGETGAEVISKIDAVSDWLDKHADALNVEVPSGPDLHSVPATPATPQAAPAPNGNGNNMQTIHAIKLQIEPRADGKVNVKFFEAGHQYPDLTAVKTPAEAAVLLQPLGGWTPQHMVAREDAINAVIDWKPSANLNKNGKPYKNIVTVSPA